MPEKILVSPCDILSNVFLVGSAGAGKTQFWNQYVKDCFDQKDYSTTQEVYYGIKTLKETKSNKKIKLKLYDTAGEEIFRRIVASYYKDAQTIVYFVDVTKSLDDNKIEAHQQDITKSAPKNVPVVIVMSKVDVAGDARFTQTQLEEKLEKIKFKYEFLCPISSKTRVGFDTFNEKLLSVLVKKAQEDKKGQKENNNVTIPPKKVKRGGLISRIKKNISKRPIAVSILMGVALGVALSATGVFTPVGLGVLGIIGLGVIGGAVVGLTAAMVSGLTLQSAKQDQLSPTKPLKSSPTYHVKTTPLAQESKRNIEPNRLLQERRFLDEKVPFFPPPWSEVKRDTFSDLLINIDDKKIGLNR